MRSYKGERKSVGRQQMGSKILLSFVKELSDQFPILKEARREVLEDLMDVKNACNVLYGVEGGTIKVEVVNTRDIPSPFALNLIAQGYMDMLKIEDRAEFIRRMHETLLWKIKDK